MAENRAAFSLRRRRSLGFSKCRWLRTTFNVPSRSIFFFNRRSAFSTGSPFLSLISVKTLSLPLQRPRDTPDLHGRRSRLVRQYRVGGRRNLSTGKSGRKPLAFPPASGAWSTMALPNQPVTLTVEQIAELNSKLSTMRHDINNQLSLIIAALELIRHKPQTTERRMATLVGQPPKIADALGKFSAEFERSLRHHPPLARLRPRRRFLLRLHVAVDEEVIQAAQHQHGAPQPERDGAHLALSSGSRRRPP